MSQQTTALTGPLTLLQCADVAAWYEAFTPKLRGLLMRHDVPDSELDDVLHDVFVRVIEHAAHIATLESAHRRNYVYRIAESVLSDRARKFHVREHIQTAVALGRFRDAGALHVEPVTASDDWRQRNTRMEQTTAARMTLAALWDAVPDEDKPLFLLVARQASRAQMAAALGVTESAVSMRLFRLRRLLREVGRKIA